MNQRNWTTKPPVGTAIDPDHPLRPGLAFFFPLNEGGGAPVSYDAMGTGLALVWQEPGQSWISTPLGTAANFADGVNYAASNKPCGIAKGQPFTVATRMAFDQASDNSAPLSIGPVVNSGTPLFLLRQQGTAITAFTTGPYITLIPTVVPGHRYTIVYSWDGATVRAWVDGVPVYSGAIAQSAPFTMGLFLGKGYWGTAHGSADYVAGWAGRALLDADAKSLSENPWSLFVQRSRLFSLALNAPGILSITPSPIYVGRGNSVTLKGYETSWTGSTTFSVSGLAGAAISNVSVQDATTATATINPGTSPGALSVSDGGAQSYALPVIAGGVSVQPGVITTGASSVTLTLTGRGTEWTPGTPGSPNIIVTGATKQSQHVSSATSASVVVSASSSSGSGTVSDGVNTATFQVVAPALAATPATGAATGTYTITLTGTGTAWTQRSPSGLFTASGAGAAISNIAVQTDVHATATLQLASISGGAVTLTDTSTGATASFASVGGCVGALHIAGPCMLQHTGGAVGLFGGQSAAAIRFRFLASSNAGLNLTTGTQVLDFATKHGVPYLVTYFPATQTLKFLAYGALTSGAYPTFAATLPVQLGVGYDFLLSWANGSQALYCNGQVQATGTAAAATYGYAGLMMGGNAGTNLAGSPQAMDHAIADVAIWSGYAPTQAEALALAQGTKTPLQVGPTGASAWWPLGGGTVGMSPATADLSNAWGWLTDFTGNSNVLSLASTSLVPNNALSGATYAAAIAPGNPFRVDALVTKCGKLVAFRASGAAAQGGVNPPASIAAINGTPTVHRNGAGTVQLGPPIWYPATADCPEVYYPLQCGSVQAVAIVDGGSDYTSPTVTAPGLTFGAPVLQAGVTGYTVTNGGSGYNQPPAVTIGDSNGGTGTGALAYAVVQGGQVVKVVVTNGGSNYTNPVVTFSPATGGVAATVAAVGGSIPLGDRSVTMTNFGSGYGNPPAVTVGAPPNTGGPLGNKAAQAYAVVYGADAASWGGTPGAVRAVVPLVGGLLGCGSGYAAAPNVTIAAPASGSTATATAKIGKYIASVPVTNGGAGLSAPPVLTVTDAGGTPTRAASLLPLMTGAFAATMNGTLTAGQTTVTGLASTTSLAAGMSVSGTGVPAGATIASVTSGTSITLSAAATVSGTPALRIADVFTYDAPASWLSANINANPAGGANALATTYTLTGLQATAGAAVANYAGQFEPDPTGVVDFTQVPAMLAGGNHGATPALPGSITATYKNKLHSLGAAKVLFGTDTITTAADGTPISWTNGTGTVVGGGFYAPAGANIVDGMGVSSLYGQWTLQYDDPQANTANASAVWLACTQPSVAVTTPVSLSGPAQPIDISANVVMSGTAVQSITLPAPSVLGTGWQGAAVWFVPTTSSNTNFASATVTVANGVPTAINVITGGNYTTAPKAYLYGTRLTGTTVTAIFDNEFLPATTPGTGPTDWDADIRLHVAQPQGQWNLVNPWAVAPDARTHQAAAFIDRTKPYAVDDAVLAMLTTPSGRTVGTIRFMDATGNYGGTTNYILPGDIPDGSRLFWSQQTSKTVTFQFARTFNTDPAQGPAPTGNGTYGWVSTKVYGSNAAFVSGTDSFGSYIALPPSDMGKFLGPYTTYAIAELRTTQPGGHGLTTGYLATYWGTISLSTSDGGIWPHGSQLNPITIAYFVTGPDTIVTFWSVNGGTHQPPNTPQNLGTAEIPIDWQLTVSIPSTNAQVPYEYAASMCNQLGCGLWLNLPHQAADATYQLIAQKVIANIGPTVPVYLEYGNENWQANYYQTHAAYSSLFSYLPAGTPVLGTDTTTAQPAFNNSLGGSAMWTGHAQDVFAATWAAAGMDPSRLKNVYGSQMANPAVTTAVLAMAQRTGRRADCVCVAPYVGLPNDPPVVQAIAPAGSAFGGAASLPVDVANDLVRRYIVMSQGNASFSTGWNFWKNHGQIAQAFGQPILPVAANYNPVAATCTISGGQVQPTVTITNPGVGFLTAPTVTFSAAPQGGTTAQGTATIANGQLTGVTVTNPGSGYTTAPTISFGGGGSLPANNYWIGHTFVDGSGNETTLGLSPSNTVAPTANQIITGVMPPWPPWAQSLNWYIGPNTAPGICTRYATVSRAQYTSTYPAGSLFPFNNAIPAGYTPPPATNQATADAAPTAVVTYEGSIQRSIWAGVPLNSDLNHDCFHHPSYRDAIYGWHVMCQQGNPMVPGSGAALSNYFEIFFLPSYTVTWALAYGVHQLPGDGLGNAYAGSQTYTVAPNQFATVQGGAPADGHDHTEYNVAPGFQALRDWADASSPAPAQPPAVAVRTRRWYAGLTRSSVRLGR